MGTIVDQAEGGLELEYRGVKVQRVTQTSAAFWNGGCEPIRSQDVAASDPIRFGVSGNILKAELVDSSGEGIELEQVSANEVLLRFDVLGMDDGARVEFVHDGAGHEATFCGTIRSATGAISSSSPRRYLAVLLIPIVGGLPELLTRLNVIPHQGVFKWIFVASLVLLIVVVFANYETIAEAENRSEIGLLWAQNVPERLRRNAQSFRTPAKEI